MVDGMGKFAQNMVFLKNSAILLATLAMHPSGARLILGRGAIPAILKCLATYPDSPGLVVKLVHTLLNIITVENASASVLLANRAGKLVRTIQKRHVANHSVKKVCTSFLLRLQESQSVEEQLSSIRDRLDKPVLNMVLAGSLFRKMCRSAPP